MTKQGKLDITSSDSTYASDARNRHSGNVNGVSTDFIAWSAKLTVAGQTASSEQALEMLAMEKTWTVASHD